MATSFKDRPNVTENLISVDALRSKLNQRSKESREDLNITSDTNVYENKPLIQTEKSFSVGLYEVDESLGYFMTEVLKPTVIQGNELIPVPTIYGSPERWKSLDRDGLYRDEKSKIILPLIMYRRTSLSRNENLYFPRLQDHLYFITKRKYDIKNKYNSFNILNKSLTNKDTTDRYAFTAIPNFVIITYEGMIWMNYIEQINEIVEKIVFSEGTYWGDPKKFKFRTEISDVSNEVDLSNDMERTVRANFQMTLYGYILPEEFDYQSTTRIATAPRKITFNTEVVSDFTKLKI